MTKYIILNIISEEYPCKLLFEVDLIPDSTITMLLLKRLVSDIPENCKKNIEILECDDLIYKQKILILHFLNTDNYRKYFGLDPGFTGVLECEKDSDAMLAMMIN